MNLKRIHLLQTVTLSCLLISGGLCAQIQDTAFFTKRLFFQSDNRQHSKLDSLVGGAVLSFMQSPQNCGLSIGIVKNDTAYFYNYGETKRQSKILPSPATVYEIGSVTTTFCGILLAQAVVEKRVKLDDDIRLYLPGKYSDLVFNKKPVLLKHLANHTSGISHVPENLTSQPGYDSLNPYKNYTAKNIYTWLKTVELKNEPGTVYNYSSTGMALLGLILEKIYDRTFDELVKEKICAQNNMMHTGVQLPGLHQTAEGYNQDGLPTPAWQLGAFSAAGGLKSTSADMLAYLRYNLQDKDPAVICSHVPTFKDRQTTGLGWFIKKTKYNNTLTWNNGATFGFAGFCGFIKEKNCGVIVLSNAATSVDHIGIAILNYLQQ